MSDYQRLKFLRLCLGGFSILLAGTAYQLSIYLIGLDVIFSLTSEWWLVVIGITSLSFMLVALLPLTWTRFGQVCLRWVAMVYTFLGKYRIANIAVLLLMVATYPRVIFGSSGEIFTDLFPRFLIYAIWVLVVSVTLKQIWPTRRYPLMLASAVLLIALLHQGVVMFQAVSAFPFSLGWSEVSRYYYGSLFLSERIYGFEIPPSVLHPTRYMMQAVPFIVDGLPLWFHRLWQVLLWIGITVLSSVLLVRRLKVSSQLKTWLIIGWVFLFLLVGPVYYHLQVAAILVLWRFDHKKIWPSTIFIIIASVWAGISRVNWYPVPGMLAAVLYLLEKPISKDGEQSNQPTYQKLKSDFAYLAIPILWVLVGTLIAFGSQMLYVLWSGNDPGQFTSSFSSDLLWYRLWPNTTYPLGILPAVVLFSLPFWILIFVHWRQGQDRYHQLRWLGIISILAVLFGGGLVVSVKIGGGSNLHNMDAYLMILLVVAAYLYSGCFAWETDSPRRLVRISGLLSAILLLIPIIYLLPEGGPIQFPNQIYIDTAMDEIKTKVTQTTASGGDVLFVTQRHLLTFDTIPETPLIPDYEVVFLMEMAMGNNQHYLNQFYEDIDNQHFDLIIIDWLPESQKSMNDPFSEEHNAWFLRVAQPLQKAYTRWKLYDQLGIEVIVPKR